MAGVDLILRLVGGTLALLVIAFVAAVGVSLYEPIHSNVIDPELMNSLGWGTPQDTVILFAGLAFAGLSLTVIIWWLVAPAREDVRQEFGGPF